ncbi:MAG: DUF2190 family protein [Candidatus Bathyarchaeia archaeon]
MANAGDVYTLGIVLDLKAGGAINRGSPVKIGTANGKVISATDGADPIGVALKAASADGDPVPVLISGAVYLTASAAIARGAAVQPAGNGKVKSLSDQAVDEGGTATYTVYYNKKLGKALEAASADGDVILVQLAL